MTTLRLPLPPSRNTSADAHWSQRHRKRNAYFAQCNLLLLAKQMPPAPKEPPPFVWASAVCYVGAAHDDDNMLARLKMAADWMKVSGYITDDRRKNFRWKGLPDQVVKRSTAGWVEITVTEE